MHQLLLTFKKSIMVRIIIIILIGWLCGYAQSPPQIRMDDKIRIREAMKISGLYGDKIWSGFSRAPFCLILVTDSVEFLINHPAPSADFTFLGEDSFLSSKVYYRRTVFNKHFLATFPAVNRVNTIVVGTPENTGKHSTAWIITLLHEHFHQYVNSSPGYYADVDKLDLSGGDKTGMWMLNYPFPYHDSTIVNQYNKYVAALARTLVTIGTDSFKANFNKYCTERSQFQQIVPPADYRYFSFQIWQEGLARYTEYKFLELLDTYRPSAEVLNLVDFVPFGKYRDELYREQYNSLITCNLTTGQRSCFYAVGFAEGLILDQLNSSWRENYLTQKFYIEKYAPGFNSPEK
jgi:hypothetical protein